MNTTRIFFVSLLVLLLLGSLASAITASIGNSRMILRVEPGEEIERYVLVKNTNNVSVIIEVFASGDLVDHLELADEEFTLAPGEEKKAYFTITPPEAGTTTTNVNVRFTPEAGGDGVGLTSTVIVVAGGGDDDDRDTARENDDDAAQAVDSDADAPFFTNTHINFNNLFGRDSEDSGDGGLHPIFGLLIVVVLLLGVLLFLLARKPKSKKDVHGR